MKEIKTINGKEYEFETVLKESEYFNIYNQVDVKIFNIYDTYYLNGVEVIKKHKYGNQYDGVKGIEYFIHLHFFVKYDEITEMLPILLSFFPENENGYLRYEYDRHTEDLIRLDDFTIKLMPNNFKYHYQKEKGLFKTTESYLTEEGETVLQKVTTKGIILEDKVKYNYNKEHFEKLGYLKSYDIIQEVNELNMYNRKQLNDLFERFYGYKDKFFNTKGLIYNVI